MQQHCLHNSHSFIHKGMQTSAKDSGFWNLECGMWNAECGMRNHSITKTHKSQLLGLANFSFFDYTNF